MDRANEGGDVHVAASAIYRRLRKVDAGVFLVLRPAGGKRSVTPADLAAATAALETANALMPGVVAGQSVSSSPHGAVVQLDHAGAPADTDRWLGAFADGLRAAGWAGTVGAAAQAWLPQWLDKMSGPRLASYAAYRTSLPPYPAFGSTPEWWSQWGVDERVTEELCAAAVQWGALPGADVYLSQGRAQVLLEEPDVSQELRIALKLSAMTGVTYVIREPLQVRRVQFAAKGEVTWTLEEPSMKWQDCVVALRSTLLLQAHAVDLGFIRPRQGWSLSWGDLAGADPRLPHVDEADLGLNRHLWGRYTPDAHGVQVLTGAHLAKASDLSAWDVEEVAPDRHLVQARDLTPWFSGSLPQPDALDQARRDFGDMILTKYHLPIRWSVVGPAGFCDVHLGQYRTDLRARCATSGIPAATADRTDHFESIGLTVTYDESDFVRRIALTSPAEPTLIGIRLLTRPAPEVFAHLRSANIEVADDGLVPEHGFRLRSVDGTVFSVSFGGWD